MISPLSPDELFDLLFWGNLESETAVALATSVLLPMLPQLHDDHLWDIVMEAWMTDGGGWAKAIEREAKAEMKGRPDLAPPP